MAFKKAGRYDEVLLSRRTDNIITAAVTAEVKVFESDGTTAATLYSDAAKTTTEADHVISPDADGNIEFFANPGVYVLKVYDVPGGNLVRTDTVIVPPDPDELEFSEEGTFNVKDYGAVGDGATDDATAVQAAIDAAEAAGGGVVHFPPGDYRVASDVVVNGDNVTLRGVQGESVISRDTNATWVLSFVGTGSGTASSGARVIGLTFDANGSSAAASTDERGGLRVSNFGDVEVRYCRFRGAQNQHPLRIATDTLTSVRRVTVSDCIITDSYETDLVTTTSTSGVYTIGNIDGIRISRVHVIAPASNPLDIGVFTAGSTGLVSKNILIDGCHVTGTARNGVGINDENSDGTFRVGESTVRGCVIRDCAQSGIKSKANQRVVLTGNHISGCDTSPEDPASGLQGSIFVNALEAVSITDNVVVNAGTNGIRVEGAETSAGGASDGTSRGAVHIGGNAVLTPTEAGIHIHQRTYDVVIIGNVVRDGAVAGIRINGINTAAEDHARNIIVAANSIFSCAGQAIYAQYVDRLTIHANICQDPDSHGIQLVTCTEVSVMGNRVYDAGTAAGHDGIRVEAGDRIDISNNRVTGATATRYAVLLATSPTNVSLLYNDLAGTATGAVSGTPTLARGNVGYDREGFFGTGPQSKPGATNDIKDSLVTLGLIADGGATPLNLDGGDLTVAGLFASGGLNHTGSMTALNNVTLPLLATTDIKDLLVSLGLVSDGGASPLNLDGGALTVGDASVSGALAARDATITETDAAGTALTLALPAASTGKIASFTRGGTEVANIFPQSDTDMRVRSANGRNYVRISDTIAAIRNDGPTFSGTQFQVTDGNADVFGAGTLRIRANNTGLGFFGATPVARPAAYTPTNVVADRAYDADLTTVDELADVLGTLIADLQSLGLIG